MITKPVSQILPELWRNVPIITKPVSQNARWLFVIISHSFYFGPA